MLPHIIWLFNNNFVTILYGINRSGLTDFEIIDHLKNPLIFLIKQCLILSPFFLMVFIILKKKIKIKINIQSKNNKTLFLIVINIVPLLLILFTSIFSGAEIRTMWMTPFYLFFGTLFFLILKKNIEIKKIKKFYFTFLFFFLISPLIYCIVSLIDTTKRTDYPGKEISRLVQNKWDDNFTNEIKIVIGDEWYAGNLSYHLRSRPTWFNDLKNKASLITGEQGVVYAGNPKVLKKICPGIFGEIKPVGYCMIGKR